jgi:hypothetical protein
MRTFSNCFYSIYEMKAFLYLPGIDQNKYRKVKKSKRLHNFPENEI